MRSRYSAFALKLWDYLVLSTSPKKRHDFETAQNRLWMEQSRFLGLTILSSSTNGNLGYVHFKVTYLNQGATRIHEERSRFIRFENTWYYDL